MEVQVAIVSCKNCIFTQNAESIVLGSLDSINKGDIGDISLRVVSFDLRELCHNSVAVTVRKAKVKIVIITHTFLDELKSTVAKNHCQVHLNRILQSSGVICVLMRIESQEVFRNYSKLLPNFMDWKVMELRANKKLDSNFSKSFQESVIQCYNHRAKYNESKIMRLNTPFWSYHQSGQSEIQSLDLNVKPLLISTTSDEGTETITIKLNESVSPSDELTIQLRKADDVFSAVVQIPDNLSPDANSQGCIVKVEAPFLLVSNIFPNEDDPIDQMLQKFPGYKQYLDDHLSQALEQVYAVGSSVQRLTLLQEFINGRDDLLPTVLHFAAYYDLKETLVTLLEKGDGLSSFDTNNSYGDTPIDIAKHRGYDATVGQILRDYEGLIDTFNAIQYIQSAPELPLPVLSPNTKRVSDVGTTNITSSMTVEEITSADVTDDSVKGHLASISSEDEDLDDFDLESNPRSSTYINIEVVPPNLPERKTSTATGQYSVPPSEAIPVVLIRKDGTIPRTADNYLFFPNKITGDDDTMSRLNRTPRRRSTVSFNSTSDEDEDIGFYNRPVPPRPPARVVEEISKKKVHLDPMEQELVDLMKQAVTRDTDWDQVIYMFESWKQSPGVLASDDQKLRDLERIRVEYHEMQKTKRREIKEGTGFLDRVVQRIKNAGKKKTSNVGIRSSGESSTEDTNLDTLATPPLPSPGFLFPAVSPTFNMQSERQGSISLSPVMETVTEKPTESADDVKFRQNSWSNVTGRRARPISFVLPSTSTNSRTNESEANTSKDEYLIFDQEAMTPPSPSENNDFEETPMLASIMTQFGISDSSVSSERKDDYATSTTLPIVCAEEPKCTPPPPRPPKKALFKKLELIIPPPPIVTTRSIENLETQSEMSDAERRPTKPKPTRRNNITTRNVNYMNYKDVEGRTETPVPKDT